MKNSYLNIIYKASKVRIQTERIEWQNELLTPSQKIPLFGRSYVRKTRVNRSFERTFNLYIILFDITEFWEVRSIIRHIWICSFHIKYLFPYQNTSCSYKSETIVNHVVPFQLYTAIAGLNWQLNAPNSIQHVTTALLPIAWTVISKHATNTLSTWHRISTIMNVILLILSSSSSPTIRHVCTDAYRVKCKV